MSGRDPKHHLFPPDYELLVVSDVSETAAVLRMYSRMAGEGYDFLFIGFLIPTDFQGLIIKTKEHFWSHVQVVEYLTHHFNLRPPNMEREFVDSDSIRHG